MYGPFDSPAPGDLPLPQAPLIRVLAQVRFAPFTQFSANEEAVASRFADAMGQDYPLGGFTESGTGAASLAMEATPSTNSGMASSFQHSPLAGRPAGAENHEPPATVVRSDQEELLWIKEQSGLTWEQLGRVFGVSRRAVHLWANGGRMNEANARTLRDFASTVQAISSDSPEMTRAALMSRDADGLSSLDRLRRSNVKRSGETWGSPFLPEYKVAADIGGKDAAE